jgi:hypothetical protein
MTPLAATAKEEHFMRSVRFTVFLVCVALWLLAGAAGASENVPESVLLREWPELKNAAAPSG